MERELEKIPQKEGGKEVPRPKRDLGLEDKINAGIPYAVPDEKREEYLRITHPLGGVVYRGQEKIGRKRRGRKTMPKQPKS
ncbi:MAG: hypothetical protein Q7S44_02640 [bacterium]|nr:hypothetical protein [bacterium]